MGLDQKKKKGEISVSFLNDFFHASSQACFLFSFFALLLLPSLHPSSIAEAVASMHGHMFSRTLSFTMAGRVTDCLLLLHYYRYYSYSSLTFFLSQFHHQHPLPTD